MCASGEDVHCSRKENIRIKHKYDQNLSPKLPTTAATLCKQHVWNFLANVTFWFHPLPDFQDVG